MEDKEESRLATRSCLYADALPVSEQIARVQWRREKDLGSRVSIEARHPGRETWWTFDRRERLKPKE